MRVLKNGVLSNRLKKYFIIVDLNDEIHSKFQ